MSLSFHLRGHERARSSHAVRIQRREKLLSVRVAWGKSHTEVELGGTLMGGNSWRKRKRVGTSPGGRGKGMAGGFRGLVTQRSWLREQSLSEHPSMPSAGSGTQKNLY